jgi:hypothetical protein
MANEVQIDIELEVSQAVKGIKKLDNSVEKFAKDTQSNLKSTTQAFNVFAGSFAAGALLSGLSATKDAILEVGTASLKAASDAEETQSKFNTVFSSISQESNKTADDLAKNFGLASSEARKLLGDTGDLLTGFGFSQGAALDLSNQVQELAVDLASFTNFSGGAAGASEALTKALLGERESVKALGISILETDVQRQISINKAEGVTFATEREAKAYATLQLAVKQSGNAIGDFARTSQGLANQQRILDANLQTTTENFGAGLIPAFTEATSVANKFLSENQELVKSFGEIAGSTVTEFFGFLVDSIVPVGNAIVVLNDIFNGLLNAWDITKLAVNELAGAFIDTTVTILEAARAAKEFLGLDTSGLDSIIEKTMLLKEANQEVSDGYKESIGERVSAQRDFEEAVNDTTKTVSESLQKNVEASRAETEAINQNTQAQVKNNEVKSQAPEPAPKLEAISDDDAQAQAQEARDKELADIATQNQAKIDLKKKELEEIARLEEEKRIRDEELKIIQQENRTVEDEARIAKLQEVMSREEAVRAFAREKALEGDKKNELTRRKVVLENEKKITEAKKKEAAARTNFSDLSFKAQVNAASQTSGLLVQATQNSGKAGKKAAIADATIKGFQAIQTALNGPFPLNLINSALITAITAGNISKIKSAPAFEQGGIVPGTSFTGDNVTARVNSGEMILNQRQQGNLFEAINSGGAGGSAPITIQGNVMADDDSQVDRLIERIKDAQEFNNQTILPAF